MKRISILLVFALVAASLFADSKVDFKGSAEKSFVEEFKVNNDAMLKVSNQFGSIEILNWDQNKVNIRVDITVETSSDSKAQQVIDGIDVRFSGSRSKVEAITEMENNLCSNGCNINVEYTIKIPSSLRIDLLQKFGDIDLEELDGVAKIGVKYGDIVARRLNAADNEVFLKFGNAELEYIKSGKLNIEYAEGVSIDKAESLDITSSYSELSIGEIERLKINSSYDEIEIDQVSFLQIKSGFTESEIEFIGQELIADLKYGEFEVSRISDGFEKIEIDTEFADVELGINNNISYQLEAETKFADIDYPDNSKISVEKKSFTENRYKGHVGDNAGTNTHIRIFAKHANVELD